MLRTENISYSIGKKKILDNISATFLPGEFNMILGPNGSGKSTFLKIFSAEIRDHSGNVFYGTDDINHLKKETLAKQRAVMSQQPELSFPLTVAEVVMMGRYPHFTFNPSKKDTDICEASMELLQLTAFGERNYLTLSGGEKQRVHYARILAQLWERPATGNRYLFLDEPLASLDINYQQEFLKIAKVFAGNDTVLIAVIHDINLAIQYADKLFFFKEGKLVANGTSKEIITEALIENVFAIKVNIINNPISNDPLLVYRNT
jgi:iron complex transport system ATP-binding protein